MRRSTLIALLIAVGVAGWLASPHLGLERFSGDTPDGTSAGETVLEEAAPAAGRIVAVRTSASVAEPIAREVVLNGRTAANRIVEVAAETSGRVVELLAEKGDAVAAGAVIARLDRRDREAAVAEARATLEQRTIEHDGARRLGERGFQAETQVAAARSSLESARYHLRRTEIELGHTEITAPFDGVIEIRPVELGSFVEIGNPVARIVDLDPILVVSDVPEAVIAHVRVGSPAEIRLVGGSRHAGRIRFAAREANERTRTFRIEVAVDNPRNAIPAGISTALALTLDPVTAHRISPGILVLDDAGALGVKTVEPDGTVAFHPIEIVRAEAETLWVAGLPDEAALIVVGQGFVTPGQQVAATDEEQVAAASAADRP